MTGLHIVCLVLGIMNLLSCLFFTIPDFLRAFFPKIAPLGASTGSTKVTPSKTSGGSTSQGAGKRDLVGKKMGMDLWNNPMYLGKVFNCLSACGYIGFSVLRLTTEQLVGSNFPVTVANAIGGTFFWASVFTMLFSVVELSCKASGLKKDEFEVSGAGNVAVASVGSRKKTLKKTLAARSNPNPFS